MVVNHHASCSLLILLPLEASVFSSPMACVGLGYSQTTSPWGGPKHESLVVNCHQGTP